MQVSVGHLWVDFRVILYRKYRIMHTKTRSTKLSMNPFQILNSCMLLQILNHAKDNNWLQKIKQNHDFAKFTLDPDECLHNHDCSVFKILMTFSSSVLNYESEIQSLFMCWQRKTHWAGIFLSKLLSTFLAEEMHSNWFSGHRRNWFPRNLWMIDY